MVRLIAAVLVLSTVSGCGRLQDSNLNPFNWLGGGRGASDQAAGEGTVNPLIPKKRRNIFIDDPDLTYRGQLVAEVSQLSVDRTTSGVILRATGVTQGLNAYDVRLVPDEANSTADTLAFELRAVQPNYTNVTNSQAARRVSAGHAITVQGIRGVRTIRVTGAGNSRTIRP